MTAVFLPTTWFSSSPITKKCWSQERAARNTEERKSRRHRFFRNNRSAHLNSCPVNPLKFLPPLLSKPQNAVDRKPV